MFTEKLDGEALVGVLAQADEEEMRVVRHQYVDGAGETVTGAGVEQVELPRVVERRCEPAGGAVFECERPVDDGAGTIVLGGQTGEVALVGSLVLPARVGSGRVHSLALAATF